MPREMLNLLVPLLTAAVVAVLGFLFSLRISRLSKRRDLRVQYLIEAYRRLETVSNRHELGEQDVQALESAIADIQLFGSAAQVELAARFAKSFADSKTATLDELLSDLRSDLRQELALGLVCGGPMILRIGAERTAQRRTR